MIGEMSAAVLSPARPLLTASQLERQIEDGTPVAILDVQLMQLAQHPQRKDTDSLCELLAVLDQQHRRGRLDIEEMRQLQARIAPLVVSNGQPVATPPPAPPPPAVRAGPLLRPVPSPSMPVAPAAPAAPSPLAPGRLLRGRYELRRLLGEGGMSCVWEAIDRLRDPRGGAEARVALKVLRPSLAARPDAVQALHLEFERAQRLSHPAIVNVLGLDADGDIHFITMERLEGELLGDVIKRLRPATLRRDHAFSILARLGDAVAFAHEAGIVHADIKPGNVMLTFNGTLRLFDFGAAWPAQREPWIYEASERSLQGATPTYASAERLGGAAPTVRDDVFSFCCVAYELLAGRHPFDRQPAHEAERNGLRPRRIRGLSRRQWRALKRGLAFRREDRWPDMRLLLDDLLPPDAGREALPVHPVAEAPKRSTTRSGLTMLLLGAAAFAVAHWASTGLPEPLRDLAASLREAGGALLAAIR